MDGPRIRRIDSRGIITTVIGTGIYGSLGVDGPATSAQIGQIKSLAFDQHGNLYFSEYVPPNYANRIRRLTPDGDVELVAGADLSCQSCSATGDGGPAIQATFNGSGQILAFDNSGNLYLSDATRVRVITPDGNIHAFAAYEPATSTYGSYIYGLTIDAAGFLYVAVGNLFPGNSAWILRISQDGKITPLAGGGKGQDVPALQAFLNRPSNIYPDGNGGVLFSDPDRLRHLTPDGNIVTLAGGTPQICARRNSGDRRMAGQPFRHRSQPFEPALHLRAGNLPDPPRRE